MGPFLIISVEPFDWLGQRLKGINSSSPVPRMGGGSKKSSPVKGAGASQASQVSTEAEPTSLVSPASAIVLCKHLPAMAEFLRMYSNLLQDIASKDSIAEVNCHECQRSGAGVYCCLQCGMTGCWKGHNYHLAEHNQDTGHALAVEIQTGVVFCCVCNVFVWLDHMHRIWSNPNPLFHQAYIAHVERMVASNGEGRHCVGVRGLYNLGNTCFMNSVLQCLLHTNYLKKYFLSPLGPSHVRKSCAISSVGQLCVACEMDDLFCRSNDGRKYPLAPHRLLEGLWKNALEMAAYEQQDAHEMFINLRNILHDHLEGPLYNCSCIVHSIFSGVLQSDVTCMACGKVRETFDPFLDISLDLPANATALKLTDCLQRFTRAERLHATSYSCDHCHTTNQEITKQLSIRSHPKVLTIHLKRFEHGASSVKIDTKVLFPPIFNISPYMSFDNRDLGHPSQHEYHLYAVVNHNGTLDSGHYTAYVKYGNDWFWIDDACVMKSHESDVFNSNAYMLFYTLRYSDYK